MNSTLAVILLAITFIAFIYYAFKGGNMIIGFFLMAVIWSFIGGMSFKEVLETTIQGGATTGFSRLIPIVFGAWFGAVLVETGITSTTIRKAVELGGDKPAVVSILLCIVTAVILTSAYGSGIVIAIGVIILPIMFAIGVSKHVACVAFLLSIGGGMFLNATPFAVVQNIVDPEYSMAGEYSTFAIVAAVITLVVVSVMLIFSLRKGTAAKAWAATAEAEAPEASAPSVAMLSILVPVVLMMFAKWPIVPSYIVGIIVACLLTRRWTPKKLVNTVLKSLNRGVGDIAMLFGLLTTLFMFIAAVSACVPYFSDIFTPLIPKSPLLAALVIGVLSPLALFKGPLNIQGIGAAICMVMVGMGVFPTTFLFAIFMILNVIGAGCCPTTGWVMWTTGYCKLGIKDYLPTAIVWTWICCVVTCVVAALMVG